MTILEQLIHGGLALLIIIRLIVKNLLTEGF